MCVRGSVEHRRHDAVLLFQITQGCFLLYLTVFQGETFSLSLPLWTFSCFALSNDVVEFWRALCYTFCVLQNITGVLRSTFAVHNGRKKEAFNTHAEVLLQPRVRVLVWLFLQPSAGSFVLNQADKQRSDCSALFQVDHFEEPRSRQNAAAPAAAATAWPSAPPLPVEDSVVSYSRGAVSLSSEGHVGSHRWEMVLM